MIRSLCSTSSRVLCQIKLRPQTYRLLHGPIKVNEYSETAIYPPISKFRTDEERATAAAKKMVLDCDTVEEKMYQINRPKYYGWYSYMLNPDNVPADLLG